MATFYNAKRYGARNAIYAPNLIKDYLENKGNPTLTDYVLPLKVNALGYCVAGYKKMATLVSVKPKKRWQFCISRHAKTKCI